MDYNQEEDVYWICLIYIFSGKTGPTKHLWIGNIPKGIGRRDLEYLFSRYGQIEKFNYSAGRPTCNISFVDVEDAIKARTKLHGAIRLPNGQVVYNKSDLSVLPRDGFYIDYYDRLTLESRFNNRSRQNSSKSLSKSHSRQSSPESAVSDHAHSPSKDNNNDNTQPNEDDVNEDIKPEIHSRSPTPPVLNPIKERRSTDRSETSSLVDSSPLAGRTFHGALGSYLSPTDTANINNLNELMILCEQLNASATQSNTALSTVYPVQFILKSHAYDARMHFLAGSPTLTSLLLGQPGDLVAAKTELKITQRLRLEQNKLDDLEKQLRTNVTNALSINGNNSNVNTNSSRKQLIIANQTKFSILIATPKIHNLNKPPNPTKDQVKNEQTSPSRINENDEHIKIKEETTNDDNEEEILLSRLISYLAEKEAAGVISIPFYPTYQNDYNHSTKQETAAVHIFPPCQFSKKILQIICPSINFSKDLRSTTTKINDEHLMVVIIHSE
ncbi:unnamed protein product [Adineta steineri]|uniref:RRM domain-containing protein n=1 Tax=Adineta steineri TaxID=433720 RepID=A0A813UBG5_9BILA|nr:unnamed protein product [Adineta steineri]